MLLLVRGGETGIIYGSTIVMQMVLPDSCVTSIRVNR
jgi:hypothetical protein